MKRLLLTLVLAAPFAATAEPADASLALSDASLQASGLLLEGLGLAAEGGSTLLVGTVTVTASAATVVLVTPSAVSVGVITVSVEMGQWLHEAKGRALTPKPVRGGTALTLDERVIAFVPDAETRRLIHREQVAP